MSLYLNDTPAFLYYISKYYLTKVSHPKIMG